MKSLNLQTTKARRNPKPPLVCGLLFGLLLASNTGYAERLCRDFSSSAVSGVLSDSGGAGRRYRNRENCSFEIRANPGDTITLNFTEFQYELGYDYLRIYDGSSTSAPLLGAFTGSGLPSNVTASSGSMLIVHTSDSSITYNGFVANWQVTGTTPTSCPDQTVADDFPIATYTHNAGIQNWLSGWQEIGESDGPLAGISRVNNANCTTGFCLRIGEPGSNSSWSNRGASRAADLSGATSATLSFTTRTGYASGTQTVDLEVSADGGISWSPLQSYNITATSFSGNDETYDISAFISDDTQIRFISDGNNARAGLYVDDITITYTTPCLPTAVAEWRFDEASWNASNPVEDQVGGTLNGQAQGQADTVSDGQICRAGYFDGIDDYVDVAGISTHLRGTASLSFWIMTNQTGTDTAWLAPGVTGIEENGGIDDVFWGYIRQAGTISVATGDVDPNFSSTRINDNQWHHVVLTRNAGSGQLQTFVDGTLERTTNTAAGIIGHSFDSIGRIEDTGGSPEYLRGTLDEVIIFEGVLSATEVAQIYTHQSQGDNWDGTPRSCPLAGVTHFTVVHDQTGIHCAQELITVRALDANDTQVASYSASITLDTQTGRGTWQLISGAGTLSDATPDDGQATYQFSSTDGGEAIFGLSYQEGPASMDIDVWQTDDPSIIDDDTEGALVFGPSGFTVTANPLSNPPPTPIDTVIPTQTAGTDFTLHITAYGTTPDDPSCGVIESYSGVKPVEFWLNRNNPVSGTIAATIDSFTIANTSAAASPQNVTFSAGLASVTAKYKDVGSIDIGLADNTSFTYPLSGASSPFVVAPGYLEVSAVTTTTLTPNPAATTMTGAPFVASGEPFRTVVTARDAEGDITPNYGQESVPESVRLTSDALIAPLGGRNGATGDVANGQAFTATGAGAFTNTTISFDEVGIIQLRAHVADDNYLNTGPVSGPASANVGRFFPHHFRLMSASITPGCGTFSYSGQPELQIGTVINAHNLAGTRVQNYDTTLIGAAGVASLVWGAENANDGIDLGGRLTVSASSWVAGVNTINDPTAVFARSATPDGPFDQLQLSVAVDDALDGIPLDAHDVDPTSTGNCAATASCQAQAVGSPTMVRYGRITVGAGSSPEFETLDVPLRAEYWQGGGFRLHTLDNCTAYRASDATLSSYLGNLSAGETTAIQPILSQTLNGGAPLTNPLLLSAPGLGNDGSVSVELNVPAWLRFDWLGTGEVNPRERQTFGHFRGHDAIVYWDEITRD